MPAHTKQQGFTLIELLVALTIFAVLAAAGWQVFDQLQKTRERAGAQSERLSELQQAYMQVNRDLTQLLNRPVVTSSKQDAALTLSSQKMSFTKLAGVDPRFVQTTAFERVTYEIQDDKLVRLVQKNLGNDDEQPVSVVLLDKIDALKFVALDPGKTNIWPPLNTLSQQPVQPIGFATGGSNAGTSSPVQNPTLTQLPVGVEITFTFTGMGPDTPIQWRFAIPKPAPQVSSLGNGNNPNGSGNNPNGNNPGGGNNPNSQGNNKN